METKSTKNLSELRTEKVNKVQERGLKKLDELFNALWEEAQGVSLLVTPSKRKNENPKNADKIDEVTIVDSICPKCKHPVPKEPATVYEVWKVRRDTGLLKYLFDQQVGRSSQKDKETTDPEIVIIFDDIASASPTEITSPTLLTAPAAEEPAPDLGLPPD